MLHILCCAKLLLDPNSKKSCLNVASFLGHRASEIWTVTLKSAQFFVKRFLSLRQGGTCSLISLKAKNEDKFKKIFILTLYGSKTVLPILGRKKILNKTFSILFLYIVLWCTTYKEGLCKFSNKNINYKGPCDFLKKKNFTTSATRARTAKIADFLYLRS